jgi:mRNA interferase YafQ
MFEIVTSTKFLEDLKLLKKRSINDFQLLQQLITQLAENGHKVLDKKHNPHKLKGEYTGYRECDVKPDLLLIWDENDQINLLELVRTGSHSDLFLLSCDLSFSLNIAVLLSDIFSFR